MIKSERSKLVKSTVLEPKPSDVSSIDGIIKAFYESISFSSGSQPDFNRFHSLFHSQALLISPKQDRSTVVELVDVEMYVKDTVENIVLTGMERKGLVFTEIARRMQSLGSIAQVFSTFETKNKIDETKPIQRGIYSIQLLKFRQRWWILSLTWEYERTDLPIPRAFLI